DAVEPQQVVGVEVGRDLLRVHLARRVDELEDAGEGERHGDDGAVADGLGLEPRGRLGLVGRRDTGRGEKRDERHKGWTACATAAASCTLCSRVKGTSTPIQTMTMTNAMMA